MVDNKLIKDRPKELYKIEFYTKLPDQGFHFGYGSLPGYLNMDLLTFQGIQPKPISFIEEINQHGFEIQPTKSEVEYYQKKNTQFQIINVVVNVHTFKRQADDSIIAYPYAISLIAGQKRGKPQTCSIDLLNALNLQDIANLEAMYTDLSPFKPAYEGFYSMYNMFAGAEFEYHTDTIGFVVDSYFLPLDINFETEEIPMAGPTLEPKINEKFRKYRIKRYYKPFTDINPRRIWGCDSPIELFLIQALAQKDYFPKIQTLIFKNGSVFENFYHMIENKVFIKGDELITEVDLYFPEKKLAVFCDSRQHHRGKKNAFKDNNIDVQLKELGIKTLRLTGKEIVEEIDNSVAKIMNELYHS